jgi:hypothetical protein
MVSEISDSVAHFEPRSPSIFATAIQRSPPSGRSIRVEKQSLGLGAATSRFWVSQKNGAEKGDIFHVLLIC